MAYGFIYVLANHYMPGLYKIGRTDRAPLARMEELSNSTAVPIDFTLVLYAQVSDSVAAEAQIHRALGKYRVNPGREFFKATITDIAQAISESEYRNDTCHVDYDVIMYEEAMEEVRNFNVRHFFTQSH